MFCSTPLYQEPAGSLSLASATQVHAAGRRGLRLILPLMNYGSSGGGVAQYHKWAAHRAGSRITADYAALWSSDEGSECPLFYSDPASQEMYRYMAHKASPIFRPPHPHPMCNVAARHPPPSMWQKFVHARTALLAVTLSCSATAAALPLVLSTTALRLLGRCSRVSTPTHGRRITTTQPSCSGSWVTDCAAPASASVASRSRGGTARWRRLCGGWRPSSCLALGARAFSCVRPRARSARHGVARRVKLGVRRSASRTLPIGWMHRVSTTSARAPYLSLMWRHTRQPPSTPPHSAFLDITR